MITMYTRQNCDLCDVAKAVIREVVGDAVPLQEIDIDKDPALQARYNDEVPVVFVGGRKAFKYRVDPDRLRELVERAEHRETRVADNDEKHTADRAPEEILQGPGRLWTLMIVASGLVLALGLYLESTMFDAPPLVGTAPAPEVSFEARDGGRVDLTSYRGRVVLVNFWATWCPPCRQEIPSLQRLTQRLANEQDFVILAVSQDDNWAVIDKAIREFGMTFPVVRDPEARSTRAFGTDKLPESYLLDREGKIVQKWVGAYTWDQKAFVERFQAVIRGP